MGRPYEVKWTWTSNENMFDMFEYRYYYTVYDTFQNAYVDVLYEYANGNLKVVYEDGDTRIIDKSEYRPITSAEEVLFVEGDDE